MAGVSRVLDRSGRSGSGGTSGNLCRSGRSIFASLAPEDPIPLPPPPTPRPRTMMLTLPHSSTARAAAATCPTATGGWNIRSRWSWTPPSTPSGCSGGWRHFGRSLFRPRCVGCDACRPIRVDVARFRPDRSQRRALGGEPARPPPGRSPTPPPGPPSSTLYHRYHAHQQGGQASGPTGATRGPRSTARPSSTTPSPSSEWRYFLGEARSSGVGYVDPLPVGPSAITFIHHPAHLEAIPRDLQRPRPDRLCPGPRPAPRLPRLPHRRLSLDGLQGPLRPQPDPRRRRGVAGFPRLIRIELPSCNPPPESCDRPDRATGGPTGEDVAILNLSRKTKPFVTSPDPPCSRRGRPALSRLFRETSLTSSRPRETSPSASPGR